MASIEPASLTDRIGKPFRIRTAQPADADSVLTYIRSIVEETEFFVIEPDELPATIDEEQEWIQNHLAHPGKIFLLAEAEGGIIGSARLEAGPYRRIAHRCHLSIAVKSDRRGGGVGTALMASLLDWAWSTPSIEKVCLHVFATNATAIRLYQKMGFREEGRLSRDVKYADGKYVDTIIMYRFVK